MSPLTQGLNYRSACDWTRKRVPVVPDDYTNVVLILVLVAIGVLVIRFSKY